MQLAQMALLVVALVAICVFVMVLLFVRATRRGERFEGELRAASFSLWLRTDGSRGKPSTKKTNGKRRKSSGRLRR